MQETRVWSLVGKVPWRRKGQPAPVLLPGKSHGWRSLVGYSPWDCRVEHNWASSLTSLMQNIWNLCVTFGGLSPSEYGILWDQSLSISNIEIFDIGYWNLNIRIQNFNFYQHLDNLKQEVIGIFKNEESWPGVLIYVCEAQLLPTLACLGFPRGSEGKESRDRISVKLTKLLLKAAHFLWTLSNA